MRFYQITIQSTCDLDRIGLEILMVSTYNLLSQWAESIDVKYFLAYI